MGTEGFAPRAHGFLPRAQTAGQQKASLRGHRASPREHRRWANGVRRKDAPGSAPRTQTVGAHVAPTAQRATPRGDRKLDSRLRPEGIRRATPRGRHRLAFSEKGSAERKNGAPDMTWAKRHVAIARILSANEAAPFWSLPKY